MRSEFTTTYGWRVRAMSLLAGCVVWEGVAQWVGSPFLPSCTATIVALGDLIRSGLIAGSLAASLTNLAIGFAAAAIVGIATGIAMVRVPPIAWLVEPYLHAFLAAPGMIYVPLLFTMFGATRATQIGSVFLHAVFIIIATSSDALKPKNATLTAMATAFGADERQIFWKVRWPAALPFVMSGLRIGALLGVKGMVNGEMFIAYTGVGALLRTYGARFEPDKVLAILIVIVVVALTCTTIIDLFERGTPQTRRMAPGT